MRMLSRFPLAVFLGLVSIIAGPAGGAEVAATFSFAFVGCNRLDHAGTQATQSVSTANEAQLLRTFADVAATRPTPQLMILAGDIVKAKKPGTAALEKQLKAWQKLVKGQLPKSIPLVAFTGNHELLMTNDDSDSEENAEIPNPPAYAYWQRAMAAHRLGSDGPTAGGSDGLLDDESGLSYTFQVGHVLFVVLNTDSLIDSNTAGDIPLAWLGGKLAAAQQDSSIQHIFVMGHKPVIVPGKQPDSGQSTIRATQGNAFSALLNKPGPKGTPSKVRAYLAAHAHEWSYVEAIPMAAGTGTGHVPQIIAGNGGSPPEGSWGTTGNYFGYTLVSVMANGSVTAQSYGRPIPAPYWQQTPAPSAAQPRGAPVLLKPPAPPGGAPRLVR